MINEFSRSSTTASKPKGIEWNAQPITIAPHELRQIVISLIANRDNIGTRWIRIHITQVKAVAMK